MPVLRHLSAAHYLQCVVLGSLAHLLVVLVEIGAGSQRAPGSHANASRTAGNNRDLSATRLRHLGRTFPFAESAARLHMTHIALAKAIRLTN